MPKKVQIHDIVGLDTALAAIPATVDETFQSITYQASLSIAYDRLLPYKSIDLTGHGNIEITNTGTSNGSSGEYRVKQDTTPRTVTINGTAITINPASGSKTLISWRFDGTDYIFDTNYIVASGSFDGSADAEFTDENKGPILNDRTSAAKYRLYVAGGVFGIEQILTTPSAPTGPVTDDNNDTFGWTDTGGKTFSDAQYKVNAGSWTDCTANPQPVGNFDISNGSAQVRYKAVTNVSNASPALSNTTPFTLVATNQLVAPDDLTNGNWAKDGVTIAPDATTDPSGASVADKIVETVVTGSHLVDQVASSVINGTVMKWEVYLKGAERNIVKLGIFDHASGSSEVVFNVNTGVVVSSDVSGRFSGATGSIISQGSGWYKCSIITTKTTEDHDCHCKVLLQTDNTTSSYTGNASNGIYSCRAKLFFI